MSTIKALPWLLLGALLLWCVGWDPNWWVAAWLAPVAMLHFMRRAGPWQGSLIALPVLALSNLVTLHGAWPMGLGIEALFSVLMTLPLFAALLADRLLHRRLAALPSTLVLPVVWVVLDYVFGFMPGLGAIFSPAPTQLSFLPLVQVASVTGIWGLTFLIGWFAAVAVTVWHEVQASNRWEVPAAAWAATLTAVLLFGSIRTSGLDHDNATVRIASVVVRHERNYWDLILDKQAPEGEAGQFAAEFSQLEDALFVQSERAVAGGAKIIVWSEANAVHYQVDQARFEARAAAFAIAHDVYLLTAALEPRYGTDMADNNVVLFTPEGEVAMRYIKTQTWYPTESDGVVHAVDTPYGKISSVICFDLDFPQHIAQATAQGVDILLVPGFDTRPISPYHTEAGLMRAIEGGFSIVRGVNKGTSMSVDPTGRTLSLSDSFRTDDPVMFADVPTRGLGTVYGMLGDWLPWTSLLGGLGLLVLAWRGRRAQP